MSKKLYKFLCIGIFLLQFLLPSGAAFADGGSLFEHHDTVIPEQQSVENVVVVGGDATIQGVVRDAVIVFNGNLIVGESARITGPILVIGGKISQKPGALLTDNVLNISFDNAIINSLLIGGALLVGVWLLRLGLSLLMMVLPVVTAIIANKRLDPFVLLIRRSPWRLLVAGFFISLLLAAVDVLLCVTVICIPVAAVLLLANLLVFLLGLAVICMLAGEWIPGNSGRSSWLTAAGGAAVITAGVNLPFLGGLLLLGLFWISQGMMVVWLWENRKHN